MHRVATGPDALLLSFCAIDSHSINSALGIKLTIFFCKKGQMTFNCRDDKRDNQNAVRLMLGGHLSTTINKKLSSKASGPVATRCIIPRPLQRHWNNESVRHQLGRVLRKLPIWFVCIFIYYTFFVISKYKLRNSRRFWPKIKKPSSRFLAEN